ncbi:MAG: phosphatidylserine decarboxylase family protein [Ignavibacteria bacterium]|nr:phosphatidylserine decarboxylase family protein [Ignavibacteria bacterium]
MISKYGYDVVTIVGVICVIGSALSWYFVEWKILKFGMIGIMILGLAFTVSFFRDPDRVTPSDGNLVISPADGKVVLIKQIHEDEYLKTNAIQVSIFMSPLDVHVNRYPISGRVGYFKHIPGDYLVAYEEKSSLRNERTHIGVENGTVKVLFKQIAGFVARRIVANVEVGDTAIAGARFGMIKFGSRVDVIVPNSMLVKVKVGDKTIAGETVIAVVT